MEVMGAAASVAGLLSLAMQLVDTSNQVISFCESVRNAPSELERLMRLFLNVQGIAIDAQNVFGEFQRMHKDGRRAIFPVPGIAGALEECIEIVNEMKQEVNKVDGTTWAKIKFVFKTQTISEYEKRLGDSLQRFHVSPCFREGPVGRIV
ncbi:hypothetical protein PspLS_00031 [Pyricularia sp. CBS 133598]|nr:hypothetical protein PspLS_00031 [Pyricularia sp. CBS 133598]